MKWAVKCITVVNYGGKKQSCLVLLISFLFFFILSLLFFLVMKAKSCPQYGNTILGRGPDFSLIYPDIKKKKKKIIRYKISRETFVIIIDTAFSFSLFCVFFFLYCPLFYYIIRCVGVSAVTLLVCLINVLVVVSIAKLYVMKNLNLNLQ